MDLPFGTKEGNVDLRWIVHLPQGKNGKCWENGTWSIIAKGKDTNEWTYDREDYRKETVAKKLSP